eukprot:Sro2882_g339270.2  (228) ;mRNA; f:7488-8171
MGTMVTIDGTSNAPAGSHSSEKHAPILSKCMTESYGNQMGYTLESFEVNKEIDVKKDEATNNLESSTGGWDDWYIGLEYYLGGAQFYGGWWGELSSTKGNADPVARFLEAHFSSPSAKAIHEEFEANVCDCLVQSNTKTFAHAHDCKIEYFVHFPDNGPILKSVDVQPVKKVKAEKHHDGQDVVKMGTMVTIDGTSNAPAGSHSSEKHAPILSKCMTESRTSPFNSF